MVPRFGCQTRSSEGTSCAMLFFICLAFLCFRDAETAFCVPMENQHTVATAPTLSINTLESRDERVLPVGSNITIICTSNASKEDHGQHSNAQPYWIHFYFNDNIFKIHECGGRRNDAEECKVCTYVIQNTSRSNSGKYTCWAQNRMRCTEGSIWLDFKEKSPPNITMNPPAEMFISRGSETNLSCKASGFPTPVITWYKDGMRVPRKITTGFKGSSTITAFQQGKYWCRASNLEGWKRSPITSLRFSQMPTISIQPKDVYLSLNGNINLVSFGCKATGSPLPVVTWLKNNSTQANATVLEIKGISWLIIVLVENKNITDKYNCVARNSEGEVYSSEAKAIITQTSIPAVSTSLSFYRHPKGITASPGDHVVFTCAAEGSLAPLIIWLKDGLKVVDGQLKTYQGRKSSISELHISSVTQDNAGKYVCQAANAVGVFYSKDALLSLTEKRSLKDNTSASTEANYLLWTLVAAVVVLILLIVFLLFVIHKKHRNAEFTFSKEFQRQEQYSNVYITK